MDWFELDDLPKKSFAVLPFVGKLKKWIKRKDKNNRSKSRDKSRGNSSRGRDKSNGQRDKSTGRAADYMENNKQQKKDSRSNSKKRAGRSGSSTQQAVVQGYDDPLVDAGLARPGDNNRWSEEDMFKANEEILGRKIDYDGNPHLFAEQGFCGVDPHAFRVVGGSFMNSKNSESKGSIPPAAPTQYQPLVSRTDAASFHLTPFFTQGGATPWGEVVEEAKVDGSSLEHKQVWQGTSSSGTTTAINPGEALLALLQSKPVVDTARSVPVEDEPACTRAVKVDEDEDPLDVMTDAQITKRSQKRCKEQVASRAKYQQEQHEKYLQDTAFIENWVKNLPRPVHFKLKNIDALLA